MHTRNNMTLGLLVSLTILLGSIGYAQDPDDDFLAGPSVQDEVVTDEDMRKEKVFRSKDGMNRQEQGQIRMWLSTLQSLDLTEAQQKEVHSLVQKLQKAQKAFQKEYGKELRELREKSKEAKDNEKDIPDDVGTRTRELLALSPNSEEFQLKAWTLLNEDQQKDFQKKYEAAIEAMKKRREDRKGKAKSMIDDPMMDSDRGPRKGFDPDDSQFRERTRPRRDNPNAGENLSDDASMRRIRFMRRLRQLEKEN